MSEMIKEFKKGDLLYIGGDEKAQWGFPEGYPYKEVVSIVEWDGNTEGHTMLGNYFCKVYDTVLDSLAGFKLTFNLAGTKLDFTLGEASPYDSGTYIYRINLRGENIEAVLVVPADHKDNLEPGIYFFRLGDGYYPCKLFAETIHPMVPEFLPSATSVTHGTVKQMPYLTNATGDAPTAENFNQLLRELKNAGLMK